MGLSDPLVVLICVLIAGLVVAAGAALHQVVTRRSGSDPNREGILPFSNEQDHYMRQVRTRNFAHFFDGPQPNYHPSHGTTVTTTTHA